MPEDAQDHIQGITLLTIEDEVGLRKSIVDYFEDSGFTVIEAENGTEGLAAFLEHRPDIVFTDLSMPHGNGLDLIPALHRESPFTPIVVISGAGMLEDAVESMKRGAWDYVAKPIKELASLEEMARKLLGSARLLKENHAQHERLERLLVEQREYDPLTGLPNRELLGERFRDAVVEGGTSYLILLDLDNFKMVNVTFGHPMGDRLLRTVAGRLVARVSDKDTVARLGGDEFAILVVSEPSSDGIESLVASLKNAFAAPFTVDGQELFVTASMGIAVSPDDGTSMEELLQHADISMYQAKDRGKNSFQFYNSEFSAQAMRRLSLETRLRWALEREEFVLHYQPQIDVKSGEITGVESLLRWQSPSGDLIPPADFIPVLEESGLIIPVGEWILKKACAQYSAWRTAGMAPFRLSVNISAPQFHSGRFSKTLGQVLAETGMKTSALCLELTESILMKDIDETIRTLEQVRALGISLSIDDFGTGYSSLSYLRRMPISELKIDRSFIATIPGDPNHTAIVNTIIGMAHSMNMRVVAEGVETEEQLQHLAAQGCLMVQGYYFSRPLQADDLIDFLSRPILPAGA